MPVRTSKAVPPAETVESTRPFTRESLESLSDLDISGVLRMIGLDEYNNNYQRAVAVDRILQEQLHGFTIGNKEVFDKLVEKARQGAATPTKTDKKEKTVRTATHEKGDAEQNEPGALIAVAGQTGSITYGIKEVKNIGNFESLHITVSITLPLNATADDVRAAKDTMQVAKDMCLMQIDNDMKELGL